MRTHLQDAWRVNMSALGRLPALLICIKRLLQKLIHLQPVTLGNSAKTIIKRGTDTGRKLVRPSRPAGAAAILE
jgi:hypothetical protein